MKKSKPFAAKVAPLLFLVGGLVSTPALAADTGANADATIYEPISFALLLEMDFGSIIPNGGGVVEIIPATDSRDCGAAMTCIGSFSYSRLELSGSDALVRITYAPDFEITGPGDPMTVEPSYAGGSGSLVQLTGGSATLDFGARLHVNPNQVPGTYSGTFSVDVNYE